MRSSPVIALLFLIGCRSASDDVDKQIIILQELAQQQGAVSDEQAAVIQALEERLAASELEIEALKQQLTQWEEASLEAELVELTQQNSDRLDVLEGLDIATQTWVSEGYTSKEEFLFHQAQTQDALAGVEQTLISHEGLIFTNTASITTNTTSIADHTSTLTIQGAAMTTNAANIAINGQSIQNLSTQSDTHSAQIIALETSVATNSDNIDELEILVQSNTEDIESNELSIQANLDAIAQHSIDISNNTDLITNNTILLNTNAENIATNGGLITSNDTRIAVLENDYVPDLDDLFSTLSIDGANIAISGSLDVSSYIHGSTLRFRNCGSTYSCTPKQCLALCQANGERMATASEVLAFASTGNQRCAHMWMLDDESPQSVMTAYPMYSNRTTGGCGSVNTGDVPRLESVSRGISWDSTTTYDCACSTQN